MRSGFCNPSVAEAWRDPQHARCRMAKCSCDCHDQDIRDKAAALVEPVEVPEPMGHGSLQLRLANLRVAADLVNSSAVGMIEADTIDPEQALRDLYALRQATRVLADIDAALVRVAYLSLDHGEVRVEGLPAAKITRARDRKAWDSRGATFAYLAERLSRTDGEVPDPEDVAAIVLDLVGVGYVRTTPLKDMGLNPADFCTESPGRISVAFTE